MPAAAGAVAAAAIADQMLGPKEDRHLAIVLVFSCMSYKRKIIKITKKNVIADNLNHPFFILSLVVDLNEFENSIVLFHIPKLEI